MPTGRGSDSIAGVGAESTWGTPVAATQKIPFISDTLADVFNEILNPALVGAGGRAFSDQGVRITEGGFSSMFNYQLDDLIFTHFFGQRTDIGTGNEATYDLQETTENDSLTLAIEKNVSVWEFQGFKASQLVVTGSPADGIRYTLTGFAESVDLASAVNTSAVLSALAAPVKNALFQNITFSIEALGTALSAVPISGFTLTVDRQLRADEVDAQNRLQPIESGFREITFQLQFPRYSDIGGLLGNQFHTWHAADTKLYATLDVTDGTRQKTFRMNKMKVTNPGAVNVGGPELLAQTVDFRLFTDTENDNTAADFDFTTELELYEDG